MTTKPFMLDYDPEEYDSLSDGASSYQNLQLKRNQSNVFLSKARYVALVAGRRFGKTYLACTKLLSIAIARPGSTVWYIAPTYKQAKMIAWKVLKNFVPQHVRQSTNEQELSILLKNGSEISLKGADNPDSLRGVGLAFVVLDEYQDMHPEVWGEVIRPMLATTGGGAYFIGTPKGYNHFYDLYMAAKLGLSGWQAFHFTTLDGGYVPKQEYLDAACDPTITERVLRQEWEASFENMTGRVYEQFDRIRNIRSVEYEPGKALYVGIDFNLDPMTASIAQLGPMSASGAPTLRFFDEVSIDNSNTEEMAQEVMRRYPLSRLFHAYPDPAGNSGSTKAPVGQTDYTILKREGFRVFNPGRAYKIMDRVNTVNAMLKPDNGEPRAVFDPIGCRKTIKALDGQCFKAGTKIPDKLGGLDHHCDNVGYLICGVSPMKSRGMSTTSFRP